MIATTVFTKQPNLRYSYITVVKMKGFPKHCGDVGPRKQNWREISKKVLRNDKIQVINLIWS